jgi:hypothetical protein
MRYPALLMLILLSAIAYGQNRTFDEILMKNRYVDCRDIRLSAIAVIQPLYERNQIDSIYQFIEYWKGKCGPTEQQFRLSRILDIRTGKFNPDHINSESFDYLLQYKAMAQDLPDDWSTFDMNARDVYTAWMKLDHYIKKIARETLLPLNTDARLLLEFYSADVPSFEQIKNTPQEQSRFSSFYHMEAEDTRKMDEGHSELYAGFVQPIGKMSVFGVRPAMGLVFGGKKLRHTYDLVGELRFGPSSNDYLIQYNDTLLRVHEYTGLYVAGEYGYDIFTRNKITISASAGVGYEQITALTTDNDYGEESKIMRSWNLNTGFVLKYSLLNGSYVGVHTRYNFVNYSNRGGTDISGDYLSFRLVYGWATTYGKKRRTRLLE